MDWRSGLLALAPLALLAESREPRVVRSDATRSPLRHHLTCVASLVDQDPVAELQVITVNIRDGNPVRGKLTYERVGSFSRQVPWNKYAAARRRISFSCSRSRLRLRSSRSSSESSAEIPGLRPASTYP